MSYDIRSPYYLPVKGTVIFSYTDEEELLEDMKKALKELEEHLKETGYVVHKDCPC